MIGRKILVGLYLVSMLGITGMDPLDDPTVPEPLSLHATIESIGVVAPYTGDDNRNNTASIRYRPAGTSTWLDGHEMFVDRSAREWRGSLVYLSPGTEYEIEVQFTDPDGASPATVSDSIITRPDYPDVGDGGNIFYVPDDGDLQTVIDTASPGDTIRLRAGAHYTSAELGVEDSGTPGHYLTIEGEPGAHVALDGSDPDINNPNENNWHHYQDDIYYTDLDWGDKSCNSFATTPNYVGEQREGHSVRYLLFNDENDEADDFLATPPGKAFYDCTGSYAGRLYVATYDADDPDNHEMHVSRYRVGLRLEGADYVRIRNLEIRYYSWYGIHLASPGADHNIIEGNTFYGSKYQIFVGQWSNPSSSDNLIQDNHFYEWGYRDSGWGWRTQYSYARSVGIRLAYAKSGNVVRRNTFIGGHDAIAVGWQSSDTDVYENVVEEMMDEGIEVDEQPGYNIRVWGNTIRYCYSSISNQDWFIGDYWNTGPIYIFRNLIVGGEDPLGRTDIDGEVDGYSTNYAFKVGTDESWPGRIYYYHNTIYIPDSPKNGNGVQDAGGVNFTGMVSRNNIWSTSRRVFSLHSQATTTDHDLDCDNLHNAGTSTDSSFILWSQSGGPDGDGVYRNLADFQAYTGQELNGISDNNTLFDPEDMSLLEGSPEIDAGCVIVGFNDRGPWAYKGQKPDIGAFEFSNEPDLSTSTKTVSKAAVSPGENVTFTIRIANTGQPLTTTATLTDVLPAGLDYLTGTLTTTLGSAWMIQGSATLPFFSIHWQGLMSDTPAVEIRYGARVSVSDTIALRNTAQINSDLTEEINLSALVIVNGLPVYLPLIMRGW